MPRRKKGRSSVLWLLCAVTISLHPSMLASGEGYYLPTLPEDPLQPVWDDLDSIPQNILKGFKERIDSHNREIQNSLSEIVNRMSSIEDKIHNEITTLREDIDDLFRDRLINSEAILLEDIRKLSKMMITNVNEKCDIHNLTSAFNNMTATGNNSKAATTCLEGSEEERVRLQTAASRMEATVTRMEEKATQMQEAAGRMEGASSRMAKETTNVDTMARRIAEMAESIYNQSTSLKYNRDTNVSTGIMDTYLPRDCSDIHWHHPEAPSGVYQTFPTLDPKASVRTYCDMGVPGAIETGGWNVVLRRQNSSWGLENFNRSWVDYREGFGEPGEGEWWFGLAPLHSLTYRQPFQLDISLHDLELGNFQVSYTTFRVASQGSNFRLLVSGFSGNVSYDALGTVHHGEPFSTYDEDNDSLENENCASNNGGGWWYSRCHRAALTATFPTSPDRNSRAIRWYRPDGWLILDEVIMKIRPINYAQRFNANIDEE